MDWKDALPNIVTQPTSRLRLGEPLAKHTYFGIGGDATAYIEISTVSELAALARFHKQWNVPVAVIGRGSNLLVSDAGFKGIGVRLIGELAKLEVDRRCCFGRCGTFAATTLKSDVAPRFERCRIRPRYSRFCWWRVDYERWCMGKQFWRCRHKRYGHE